MSRAIYHKYTEAEKAWIVTNLHKYDSYKECCSDFNQVFHAEVDVPLFREMCTKRLHIYLGKNAGRFNSSTRPRDLPIGTIRCTYVGSSKATYIKVSDELKKVTGYQRPNWIPYQEYLYEQAYGKIPEGHMVIFLDCNHDNFDISNLGCIDRQTSVRLAQNHWYSENPEITKTGIMQIELSRILKKKAKV